MTIKHKCNVVTDKHRVTILKERDLWFFEHELLATAKDIELGEVFNYEIDENCKEGDVLVTSSVIIYYCPFCGQLLR